MCNFALKERDFNNNVHVEICIIRLITRIMAITLNISYQQMFDMVMQLSYVERMQLNRDIIKKSRLDAFHKLMLAERPVELTDEVILQECKAARQQVYSNV